MAWAPTRSCKPFQMSSMMVPLSTPSAVFVAICLKNSIAETAAAAAKGGPRLGRRFAHAGQLLGGQVVLVLEVLDDEPKLGPLVVDAHP